jgi:hypothetical protein
MAKLIFSLRNVPEDEANDIRALLGANDIEFYETPPGNWGISSPGIWLKHNDDSQQAKQLIEAYQQQRSIAERDKYRQLRREGKHRTIVDVIKEDPLRAVVYIAIVALVLYVSIKPFIHLGR